MDRLACISLPSFALQVALQRAASRPTMPLAVVKDDRPTSLVVHLNRAARDQGLRTGMRYSEALALVCDLKAVTVSPELLDAVRQKIHETLLCWSPQVEACPFDSASFWVGAGGLQGLYGGEAQWGASIRTAVAALGYRATVVVGLTRGGTYVLARSRRSTVVSAEAEQRALAQAPITLFPLGRRHQRLLETLGLTTLASVLTIPPGEVARRFGPELGKTLRQLDALVHLPLQSRLPVEPLFRSRSLESPLADRRVLVSLLEAPLQSGLAVLVREAKLLAELRVVFVLESKDLVSEVLRPAEPTTNEGLLLKLLDLRLAQTEFSTPVTEVRLVFLSVALPASTGDLFATPSARVLGRGAEALALIRAQWGNNSVVRAVLVDSHIPDQSFRWEPVVTLAPPVPPRPAGMTTAVRRIRRKEGPDGNPSGQRVGLPLHLRVVSGRAPIDKEYWFLRTRRREVVWVSWDLLSQVSRWEGVVD